MASGRMLHQWRNPTTTATSLSLHRILAQDSGTSEHINHPVGTLDVEADRDLGPTETDVQQSLEEPSLFFQNSDSEKDQETCHDLPAVTVDSGMPFLHQQQPMNPIRSENDQDTELDTDSQLFCLQDPTDEAQDAETETHRRQPDRTFVKAEALDGGIGPMIAAFLKSNHEEADSAAEDQDMNASADDDDADSSYTAGGVDHTDSEYEDGDYVTIKQKNRTKRPEIELKAKKRPRKRGTNPREIMARRHEEEDAKKAAKDRKRKQGGQQTQSGSRKSRKRNERGHRLTLGLLGDNMAMADSIAPPMEAFTARTHAEQFAKIKASIPKGFDTRRTATQQKDLKESAKLFGYRKVKAENGLWTLKSMKTPLKQHQLPAAGWMVERELARSEPYGGLLADSMGMGKTVVSLACIAGNPPDEKHLKSFCQATLVIVPNRSAALQWQQETMKHCKEPIKTWVTVYSAKDRRPRGQFENQWVVFTTYKELMEQYPKPFEIRQMEEKFDSDNVSFDRELAEKTGDLFHIKWYRVILDEAHVIKNIQSRTAVACCALKSRYRWALSGTPLANNSQEFFPYLKFIGCKFTTTLTKFVERYFTDGKPNERFEAMTSLIMYRRTTDDTFLGHRILDIPDRKTHDLWVPLSMEEQVLVKSINADSAVESYSQKKDQSPEESEAKEELDGLEALEDIGELREETNGTGSELEEKPGDCQVSSGMNRIVRYNKQMRMRQAISNPFCLEKLLREKFDLESVQALKAQLLEISGKRTILDQLQGNCTTASDISRYQKGIDILKQRQENAFGGTFDMDQLLRLVEIEHRVQDITCPICEKANPPIKLMIAEQCGHAYCSECLIGLICRTYHNATPRTAEEIEAGTSKREPADLSCRYEGCSKRLTAGPEYKILPDIMQEASLDKKFREPGRDSNGVQIHQESERNGFFFANSRLDNIPDLPSTKVTTAMMVLLTWLTEEPQDKVIVFTQFIATVKVMGKMLATLGVKFIYYCGGLVQTQKDKALSEIKENPEIKVMIATLKSCSQSLNLTVANRVIIIDPWWNNTAEQQAFGRVVRIGQQKVSYLVRIKTIEPIDQHIDKLQKAKSLDVDHSLQDDGHTPLEVNELELQDAFKWEESDDDKKMSNSRRKRSGKA